MSRKKERERKGPALWKLEVEEKQWQRVLDRREQEEQLMMMKKKPPKRFFPHLRFLLDRHHQLNESRENSSPAVEFQEEQSSNLQHDISAAFSALTRQEYSQQLVNVFCQSFVRQMSQPLSSVYKYGLEYEHHSARSFSCGLQKLSPLEITCLDSISSYFELYDMGDINAVLSALSPQHIAVLSAMCCWKNKLTDDNIFVFLQEHATTLFIGGNLLTDKCWESISPLMRSLPHMPEQVVYECWEDAIGETRDSEGNDTGNVEECANLQNLFVFSPRMTADKTFRAISVLPSLQYVGLHGKCSCGIAESTQNTNPVRLSDETELVLPGEGQASKFICSSSMSNIIVCTLTYVKKQGWI